MQLAAREERQAGLLLIWVLFTKQKGQSVDCPFDLQCK